MPKPPRPPAVPTVTFWGAARAVTGSMHRLDAGGRAVLLDCGLVQGRQADARAANATFPFRPKDIAAVLLSHAHIDHSGNLPHLVKAGFAGPIYCTPATRALAGVLLGDAAKVQEHEADARNRDRAPGEPEVGPLYDGRDVYRTLLRLRAVPYDEPFAVGPGVEATFADAGHLLGSATVHVRIATPGGPRRLLFTGDLGRPGLPILRDPAPLPAADLIVCESTYGGQTHPTVGETADRLGAVIRRTVGRGGRVVVPAFAVGRTQTVLYFLHQLFAAGALPAVPVFVDSPMAVRATEVYRAHPECFDAEARALLARDADLFGDRRVRFVDRVDESIALNSRPGPCVVVSASGMCEAGRVLHHLRHALPDPRNTVLLAGFQAPDTLGRRLADGRPEVRVLGRSVPVKAEVVALAGLSSHADHGDVVRALGPLAGPGVGVRLVHGEPDRAAALAAGLRGAGFGGVGVPDRGETAGV